MKKKQFLLLIGFMLSMGCAVRDHGLFLEPIPEPKPVTVTLENKPLSMSNGSIFAANNASATMISDTKAYRINDLVIVSISESTSATNSATTATDKKTNRDYGVPALFGLETTSLPSLNPSASASSLVSTKSKASHEGKGSTQRSGQFKGSLAARVLQVLPNNYLIIQGYKNIQVNGEQGRLYLTGIVNPLLIAKDHSIRSNQVADLELYYGGSGVVGGSQNPGWLTRLLDVVWPF
jgi:flagellar L-ring protein precursor FlgH